MNPCERQIEFTLFDGFAEKGAALYSLFHLHLIRSLCIIKEHERYRRSSRWLESRIHSMHLQLQLSQELVFDSPWNLSSALISCFRANYK